MDGFDILDPLILVPVFLFESGKRCCGNEEQNPYILKVDMLEPHGEIHLTPLPPANDASSVTKKNYYRWNYYIDHLTEGYVLRPGTTGQHHERSRKF